MHTLIVINLSSHEEKQHFILYERKFVYSSNGRKLSITKDIFFVKAIKKLSIIPTFPNPDSLINLRCIYEIGTVIRKFVCININGFVLRCSFAVHSYFTWKGPEFICSLLTINQIKNSVCAKREIKVVSNHVKRGLTVVMASCKCKAAAPSSTVLRCTSWIYYRSLTLILCWFCVWFISRAQRLLVGCGNSIIFAFVMDKM